MRDLNDIIAELPEEFRPVAAKYGPALVAMTAEELWAWIELLLANKTAEAYQVVAARLPPEQKIEGIENLADQWAEAARDNSANLALQREAALGVLRVLLTMALALVGL